MNDELDTAPDPDTRGATAHDRPRASTTGRSGTLIEQIDNEQRHLDHALRCLEIERRNLETQHRHAMRDSTPQPQSRSERDTLTQHLAHRLAELADSDQICFGRIDYRDDHDGPGRTFHIGRLGITDPNHEPVVVDWRTPIAAAFYRATPGDPHGLERRRHITVRSGHVVALNDQTFDRQLRQTNDLVGEAALMAAIQAPRSGHMSDIVATIQAEQDRIIRAPLHHVAVVQGGPGTGKTAVGLHRAAYLLYRHRSEIGPSGVLLVGPNHRFVDYVRNVIPDLGEHAQLTTVGSLFAGISTALHDRGDVALVKGDAAMIAVIQRAIAAFERIPVADFATTFQGRKVTITRRAVLTARRDARTSGLPHNEARATFGRALRERIAARMTGAGVTEYDAAQILATSRELKLVIDALWPNLTAQQLIESIFTDPIVHERSAVAVLGEPRATKLRRQSGTDWTVEDVALLDEAHHQLGSTTSLARRKPLDSDQIRRRLLAERTLDAMGDASLLDVDQLIERLDGPNQQPDHSTDRAQWKYGHVVVDEAQDLSPMQWRAIARRSRTSVTVLGDLAQRTTAAGAQNWQDALEPHFGSRTSFYELTINYRSPAETDPIARTILQHTGARTTHPSSVRRSGHHPQIVRTVRPHHGRELAAILAAAAGEPGTGAVIGAHPPDLPPGWAAMADPHEAKGLEFDTVVVVDPHAIRDRTGYEGLYIVITRATQKLIVLVDRSKPEVVGFV